MPDSDRPSSGDAEDPLPDATAVKPDSSSGSGRARVRFTPGTMLADRYRIVALLGRGGMGEVYRAEDTKLGQQVALKFLPNEFANDHRKLQLLYDEVRLGRKVSHPNVCRMYDISESEGHHFISMEYIDGEDLASLLRRIGKLPEGKALDIARDLCAGVAAAHSLGVIHRDLKPANVMIDSRGDARITDFGLAALAEDLVTRREVSGTPAYMAPEQLEGREVNQKTDLYALGLIFYEMFTGKRLFPGETLGDIISQHKASNSQSLSRETGDLEPSIQRLIVRCLEKDPSKRPPSIHSMIAALPGGDPLQAALEAGETPSPEMVAAAGSTGELSPAVAWPLLILTIVVLLGVAALSPRVRLYGQIEQPLRPIELAIKARAILAQAGLHERPGDTAWEMGVDRDYRNLKRKQNRTDTAHADDSEKRFSPLIFGYRESPQPMQGGERVSGFGSIPALNLAGMGQVVLEPDGRLRHMVAVPPQELPATKEHTDWTPYFTAASLTMSDAEETDPRWRPPVGSDERVAWLLFLDGLDEPVRIEAASFAGRPVWFEVITPWKEPIVPAGNSSPFQQIGGALFNIIVLGSMFVGFILALRNVRRGRGDRSGATRIVVVFLVAHALYLLMQNDHHWDASLEAAAITRILGTAVFTGVLMGIYYLALEPYLRRRWPRTLIAWSRLVQRRWLDSLVGRSLLIGVLAGSLARLIQWASLALPEWLGWTPPVPWDRAFLEISGWRYNFSHLGSSVFLSIFEGLIWMMILLVAHLILRRRTLAVIVVIAMMALGGGFENYPVLEWPVKIVLAAGMTWIMVRQGLLALVAMFFAMEILDSFPVTLDPSVTYFGPGLLGLLILTALAIFGFTRSLGAQAIFTEPVLEE
jgi:serine/threonine-protein kinase